MLIIQKEAENRIAFFGLAPATNENCPKQINPLWAI
jgi:hypothetical protein